MITITLLLILFGTTINVGRSDVGEDVNKVVTEFKDIGREFESKISGSEIHTLNHNTETTASTTGTGTAGRDSPPSYLQVINPEHSTGLAESRETRSICSEIAQTWDNNNLPLVILSGGLPLMFIGYTIT